MRGDPVDVPEKPLRGWGGGYLHQDNLWSRPEGKDPLGLSS
jgi:hypothetical protein